MKKTVAIIVIAGAAFAAAASGQMGITDAVLGLSKTSVFDTPAPPLTEPNPSDPGDRPAVPAAFPEQPPVIPHGIADFLPITRDDNECIECHAVEEKVEGEPTPIPPSHYTDLRNAPAETQDDLVGARYLCVSCHVSPGENPPLVDNIFGN
jgi:cytochrome c-type protein NapB